MMLRSAAPRPGAWGVAPLVLCTLLLGCPEAPEPSAPDAPYELSVLRARRLGAAMLRFDTATGRVWLQAMERRATPWKPLGDHSQAASDGEPGRFRLTSVPRGELVELLRFDTALGLAELHDLTGEKGGWRDIDQTTGAAREPGRVERGEAGRYAMQLARTNVGARLLRMDTLTGETWTMPLNGIGGWLGIEESSDPYAVDDLRFPEGAPPRRVPAERVPAQPMPRPGAPPGEKSGSDGDAAAAPGDEASERQALVESLAGELPAEIRAWAAEQLGVQGHRSAVPQLRQALDDPEPSVAAAAADALELLGDGP